MNSWSKQPYVHYFEILLVLKADKMCTVKSEFVTCTFAIVISLFKIIHLVNTSVTILVTMRDKHASYFHVICSSCFSRN